MNSPDKLTVRAIIPHAENPAQYLRDKKGGYPSMVHEAGSGTHEQTLHRIGLEVIKYSISADRRILGGPNELIYLVKAVSAQPDPESPYQWHHSIFTP